MNVKEMVAAYLEENGYEGLVHVDLECGCCLDDFMPCDCYGEDCQAAYKWPGDGEVDFYMRTDKPDEKGEQDNAS